MFADRRFFEGAVRRRRRDCRTASPANRTQGRLRACGSPDGRNCSKCQSAVTMGRNIRNTKSRSAQPNERLASSRGGCSCRLNSAQAGALSGAIRLGARSDGMIRPMRPQGVVRSDVQRYCWQVTCTAPSSRTAAPGQNPSLRVQASACSPGGDSSIPLASSQRLTLPSPANAATDTKTDNLAPSDGARKFAVEPMI